MDTTEDLEESSEVTKISVLEAYNYIQKVKSFYSGLPDCDNIFKIANTLEWDFERRFTKSRSRQTKITIFFVQKNKSFSIAVFLLTGYKQLSIYKQHFLKNNCDAYNRILLYDSFISEIGKPPNVVVTRWNTWLEAAIWYYNHFEKVKLYFCNLLSNDEKCKSVRLMMLLNNERLYDELKTIYNNYSNLCEVIKHGLDITLTVSKAKDLYECLNFYNDLFKTKDYIETRLQNNDLLNLWKENENQRNSNKNDLYNCPATTIMVERSFSMLNKVLAHDRNFKAENIVKYLKPKINK